MLFERENNKNSFDEIAKLFPGDYELKSRGTSQFAKSKQYFNKIIFQLEKNLFFYSLSVFKQ